MSALLLLILFGIPFIKIGNHPFFLFNFLQRKLILFGTVFGPHDFYLVGLSVITGIIFIILFTVVFGRLFCGWICPQTVFMEMVFRKIDYFVEGDHREQARLRASLLERQEALPEIREVCHLCSGLLPDREHPPRVCRGDR